jgi:hypothetical protein
MEDAGKEDTRQESGAGEGPDEGKARLWGAGSSTWRHVPSAKAVTGQRQCRAWALCRAHYPLRVLPPH